MKKEMTTRDFLKKIFNLTNGFEKDLKIKIVVSDEGIDKRGGSSWKEYYVDGIDFLSPEWYVDDNCRIVIEGWDEK